MSSITQTYDRSLALLLSVEKLTQQFEELERLRNRVRRAEAKAICGSRSQRRRKSPSGTLRRNKRRVR